MLLSSDAVNKIQVRSSESRKQDSSQNQAFSFVGFFSATHDMQKVHKVNEVDFDQQRITYTDDWIFDISLSNCFA